MKRDGERPPADGHRRLPLRWPSRSGRTHHLRRWPRLVPPSDVPPRAIVVRLVLALALASSLWVAVSAAQDPVRAAKYHDVPIAVQHALGYSLVNSLPRATIRVQGLMSDLQGAPPPGAFIDLTHVTSTAPRTVPVQVDNLPSGAQLESIAPSTVMVQLDKATTKVVPVQATGFGPPAPGYLDPQFTTEPHTVTVTGPSDVVNKIVVARIAINNAQYTQSTSVAVAPQLFDPAGVSVDSGVVQIKPAQVTVMVDVRLQPYRQLVPLKLDIVGAVAPNYAITKIQFFPQLVQAVSSTPLATATLTTQPIDVTGWTTSHTVSAQIVVPPNVTLNRTQATVTIDVAPIPATAAATARVQVVGRSSGTSVAVAPSTVTVAYRGPSQAVQDAVTPRVVLDLRHRSAGVYHLTPHVELARGLSPVSVTPSHLTVTIKRT